MANLETMSAKKLDAEIAKRQAKDYEWLTILINEGFGDYTGNHLDAMVWASEAPTVVIEARKASHAYHEALNEQDRRRRYHGSDKPIKKREIH